MKETTEFYNRIKGEREAQDKKADLERQEVERRFEGVSDMMARKQKKEVEKLEQLQFQQFKSKAKTLKAEQVRSFIFDHSISHSCCSTRPRTSSATRSSRKRRRNRP